MNNLIRDYKASDIDTNAWQMLGAQIIINLIL